MTIREIKYPPKVMRRAKSIRVLLMDVDGTLTPRVVCLQTFPDNSVAEMKVFDPHDGAGIKLASIMGIRTGLITGRDSPATTRRQCSSRHYSPRPRNGNGICNPGPAEET